MAKSALTVSVNGEISRIFDIFLSSGGNDSIERDGFSCYHVTETWEKNPNLRKVDIGSHIAWELPGLVNIQKAIENCHLVRGFTH
jgi:hypothetical protein